MTEEVILRGPARIGHSISNCGSIRARDPAHRKNPEEAVNHRVSGFNFEGLMGLIDQPAWCRKSPPAAVKTGQPLQVKPAATERGQASAFQASWTPT